MENETVENVHKLCTRCGVLKPAEDFYFASGTRTKRRSECAECTIAAVMERKRYYRRQTAAAAGGHLVRGRKNLPSSSVAAVEYPRDAEGRKPSAWDLPEFHSDKDELMGQVRRINCKNYEFCLDVACNLNWLSWSCLKCDVQDEYSDEYLANRAADSGLLELIHELRSGT